MVYVRSSRVPSLMTRTVAPGTAAPCESRTNPLICPLSNCARAGAARARSARTSGTTSQCVLGLAAGVDVDISASFAMLRPGTLSAGRGRSGPRPDARWSSPLES